MRSLMRSLGVETCLLWTAFVCMMAILRDLLRVQLFMRRNSVYIAFILGGAILGERVSLAASLGVHNDTHVLNTVPRFNASLSSSP